MFDAPVPVSDDEDDDASFALMHSSSSVVTPPVATGVAAAGKQVSRPTAAAAARPRLLILHGPTGCGKSTAVRVIARELGLQLREWTDHGARGHSSFGGPSSGWK